MSTNLFGKLAARPSTTTSTPIPSVSHYALPSGLSGLRFSATVNAPITVPDAPPKPAPTRPPVEPDAPPRPATPEPAPVEQPGSDPFHPEAPHHTPNFPTICPVQQPGDKP